MAAQVTVISGNGEIGQISEWSITKSATPTLIGSTDASVGSISVTALPRTASKFLDGNTVTISDLKYGTESFVVDSPTMDRIAVSFDAADLFGQLNTTQTAPPIFGSSTLSDAYITYIGLCFATPPVVNYTATSNPSVTYPGWTGNVWDMLKSLAATTRTEVAIVNGTITVRDLGTNTLDVTNAVDAGVKRSVDSSDMALTVDVIAQNTTSVASAAANQFNYSQNPSVETNATNWSNAQVYQWGTSVTASGRVTTLGYAGTSSYRVTVAEDLRQVVGAVPTGYYAAGGRVDHTVDVTSIATNGPVNISVYGTALISSHNSNPSPPYQGQIGATWKDGSGNVLRTDFSGATTLYGSLGTPTVWNRMSFSKTKPAGATSLILTFYAYYSGGSPTNTAGSDTFYWDAVLVTDGTALPAYFDGTVGGGTWTGTTNNSVSVKTNSANVSFYDARADNNTVYSVNAGETVNVTIQTTNFPASLVQPVRVTTFPVGVGQYFMSDSLNFPIAAGAWEANGGSVSVALGTVPGTIVLTMVGPTSPIAATTGPYSMMVQDSVNNTQYAQFNVAGSGVISKPTTITIPTGAPASLTQNQSAASIDIPFIQSEHQAWDRGFELAGRYAGSWVTISFTLSKNDANAFGLNEGALVKYDNGAYRVIEATPSEATVDYVAEMRNLVAYFNAAWTGKNSNDFSLVWGTKPFNGNDFSESPLWH